MKLEPIKFAREIAAELKAQAAEIEAARGVPLSLAKKLARGGLFGLFTPSWLGGLELKPSLAFEALEETAKGDMSCGWAAMISSTSALGAAWMERQAAQEIFSSPDLIFSGVAAPMGKAEIVGDRYRASGAWQWGSGSNNADYFMGGVMVKSDSGYQHKMLIFPRDKIALGDNWFVMGLSGSSSNDVSVVDCEVPVNHSFSVAGTEMNCDGALYRMPFFGLLACGIGACALGNVGGMLDEVMALATEKTPSGTKNSLSEKAYVQIDLAKIHAELNEARGQFYYTLDAMWDKVQKEKISDRDKALLRLSAIRATCHSAEIARALHTLAGGTSVFSASPIQRRLRDSMIATQHRMVSPTNYQIIGKILLGVADEKAVRAAAL